MKPQVVRHQQSQMVLLGQTLSFETQQIPQAWILAQTQMPAGSRGTGWKFSARKGLEHWWRLHCPWQTSSNDHQNCCPNSSGCPQRMQRTRVSFKTKLLGTKTRIFWSSEPWWSCSEQWQVPWKSAKIHQSDQNSWEEHTQKGQSQKVHNGISCIQLLKFALKWGTDNLHQEWECTNSFSNSWLQWSSPLTGFFSPHHLILDNDKSIRVRQMKSHFS